MGAEFTAPAYTCRTMAAETTTYRTLPSRVTGWTILIATSGLAVAIGMMEAASGNNPITPAAFLAVVAAVVWIVLLRPAVRVSDDRVQMSNLVTDIEVPYSRLKAAEHQWALEIIDNAGTKHSSWAIPVRRELRPRRDIDTYAEATTKGKTAEGNNAEVISGRVQQMVQRWKLAGGHAEPGLGVSPTWSWTAIVPLAAAVAFLVVVLLLG